MPDCFPYVNRNRKICYAVEGASLEENWISLHNVRNSLGVHCFCCLKIRLNVEMLEKPDCRAISVMERSDSARSFSTDLIRLMLRYS